MLAVLLLRFHCHRNQTTRQEHLFIKIMNENVQVRSVAYTKSRSPPPPRFQVMGQKTPTLRNPMSHGLERNSQVFFVLNRLCNQFKFGHVCRALLRNDALFVSISRLEMLLRVVLLLLYSLHVTNFLWKGNILLPRGVANSCDYFLKHSVKFCFCVQSRHKF